MELDLKKKQDRQEAVVEDAGKIKQTQGFLSNRLFHIVFKYKIFLKYKP